MRLRRSGLLPMAQIVDVDQAANHRPVLVSLGLLGCHEIRQGHDVQRLVLEDKGRPPGPQLWKWSDTSHLRHHVDPQPSDLRASATEMNGEALGQVFQRQGWEGDHLGVKLRESGLEAVEVGGVRQQGQVQVAAKLRCAV